MLGFLPRLNIVFWGDIMSVDNMLCLAVVFNLVEETNTKEMEDKIAEYRANNAESIVRNEARKVRRLYIFLNRHFLKAKISITSLLYFHGKRMY